jgi:hypothetical protein
VVDRPAALDGFAKTTATGADADQRDVAEQGGEIVASSSWGTVRRTMARSDGSSIGAVTSASGPTGPTRSALNRP